MYRNLAIVLAAFFVLGGCMNSVSAATYETSFETVVTAATTGDHPVLDINTTINNTDDQTTKHPQRRLYSPRRGASGGGKW